LILLSQVSPFHHTLALYVGLCAQSDSASTVHHRGPDAGEDGADRNYRLLLQGWAGHQPVKIEYSRVVTLVRGLLLFLLSAVRPGNEGGCAVGGMIGLAAVANVLPRLLRATGVRDEWKPVLHFSKEFVCYRSPICLPTKFVQGIVDGKLTSEALFIRNA
jgi:hypothetical protein